MSKMEMIKEMKENGYLKKERVSSAVWNGRVSKEYIENIYKNFQKRVDK